MVHAYIMVHTNRGADSGLSLLWARIIYSYFANEMNVFVK